MVNASTIFFISRSSSHSLKVNLWSNVKEVSLAESLVCNSISQLSIDGVFICCVQGL